MEENKNHEYDDGLSASQLMGYMDSLSDPIVPLPPENTTRPSRRNIRYSVPNPSTDIDPSDEQVKTQHPSFYKKKIDEAIASITPLSQDSFYIPKDQYEYVVYGRGIKDRINITQQWPITEDASYKSAKPLSDSSLQKKLDEANALIEEYQSGSTYRKGQESVFQALLEMEVFGMSLSTEELVLYLKEKLNKKDGI